jgi:hypothetical protein
MQTFLPYPSYRETATVLDYRRLGKQRVECKQIVLAMNKAMGGWTNHPATRMWRGHELELCDYAIAICEEWIARGYNDSLLPFFKARREELRQECEELGVPMDPPVWMGDDSVHASHRANLLRKDPDYYGQFGWEEDPSLPYVWPV